MKRITLFFTVLLGLSVFQTASAVDAETVRAATKRNSANTISTTQNSTRSVGSTKQTESKNTENARSTIKNNRSTQSVQTRQKTIQQPTVRQRSATQINKNSKVVSSRTPSVNARNTNTSRSAIPRKINTKTSATRTSTTKTNRFVRAAELDTDKINEIKAKDYSKCKSVYWDCMDEFCANKDSSLRRCACSSRIHEFDNIKQQLSDAEEKMIGFNQTLLTVSMDKEDALAIKSATEGEKAFEQKDLSESEKLLQKITQTLNNSSDSKINSDLSAISLDLDMDSAWDSVDSISGISTTAKSGTDLYNATQPMCIEMAKEVCSGDELSIAENSYKLAIQQDCNTVAKAYDSKYNKAMEKIHESGALLDMARLNAHQQRNSDDILTCKRKILEKLSEPAVCGDKLYRCLDITGQYINQADGSAFLSADLFNLTTLLTAPSSTDITWSRVPGNEQFVKFLNSKKTFLESATEQCQAVADSVWKDFLEDALAQIKLAQNAKLEEIKRSCTTLIAECKSSARQSLQDFDASALTTFSIMADTTINAMCADVQNACITLIDSSIGNTEWSSGVAGLEADISYDAIIENCTAIGKTCIINQCTGTNGNFSLCESISSSIRNLIINRQACWNEVQNCVAQAGNLQNMQDYGVGNTTAYLTCDDSIACKISHKIWGNCDKAYTESDSKIERTDEYDTSSLLAWFAYNTNQISCSATKCPDGYEYDSVGETYDNCPVCPRIIVDAPFGYTGSGPLNMNYIITINQENQLVNYCPGGCAAKDKWGNCCKNTIDNNGICVPGESYSAVHVQTVTCNATDNYYCPAFDASQNKQLNLYCVTNDSDNYPSLTSVGELSCGPDGYWVIIDEYGYYSNPATKDADNKYTPLYDPDYQPKMGFYAKTPLPSITPDYCSYKWIYDNQNWQLNPLQCAGVVTLQNDSKFTIQYQQ